MASHWPDELRIGLAASVVPHFCKFDFREGAPYPVADLDEYMPECPVAMRIAGAGIPDTVMLYLCFLYRQSDSGLKFAHIKVRDRYKQMAAFEFAQKPERGDRAG